MPFKLPSGAIVPIPAFGTGTKWYKPGDPAISRPVVDALVSAIKAGYRHIDGAEVYGTEPEIGVAIKETGVARDQLFVTTKVISAISDPRKALEASLAKLQLDYVDLYLIHSPFFGKETHGLTLREAWDVLTELKREGKAKDIGVSNFAVADLKQLEGAEEKVAVNQIEFNPYLQNQTPGIVEYSQSHDILIEAYTPLVSLSARATGGPVDEVVNRLATKYGKTAGQVILKWVVQRGIIPVTTSADPARQASNLDLSGFELTAEEVEQINQAGAKKHVRVYWTDKYE
ncbi:NADP-dependent oxidoreductase domain-containing protein [Lipomyces japonicus]|uniref:NADP-dependent oxidoreductase domain-containing protein n=1 Tax=Lipomyces japonicus TaxID=56871 RepID=UPI0034D0036E